VSDRRWLLGPWPDLVLGCGVGYAVVFAAMALLGGAWREAVPEGLALIGIGLVASAHYGATALRAYERAEDRRAWIFFTLWTTLALGACFVWGLASHGAGSWFLTVYLTWSPWHYALQNFGVAMTFLRRRGIEVTPGARRATYLSFVASFALAALALHGTAPQATYAPNQLESGVYAFVPLGPLLGVPADVSNAMLWASGAAWVATTVAALALLRRRASWADLAPSVVLVGTQALWFSVPVLVRHAGVLQDVDPLSVAHSYYAFLWIGAGHAVQYLWITAHFAKSSGRSTSHALFTLKSLLAGTALWTVPAVLFTPGLLGRLPYDAGLAAMVASLVNLHHFVLDGVIWKLRDSRVARFLLGGAAPPPAQAATAEPRPSRWRAALGWTAGGAMLAASMASAGLTEFGFNRAYERGDLDAARRAADRLEWLGQRSAELRLRLGQAYLDREELTLARTCLQRSVEILPTAWAWVGLGDMHARRQEWREAADAYAKALELEPDHVVATFLSGAVALEMGHAERARAAVTRAKSLAARDPATTPQLRQAIEQVLADERLRPADR
jgi:hypothetical protein